MTQPRNAADLARAQRSDADEVTLPASVADIVVGICPACHRMLRAGEAIRDANGWRCPCVGAKQ